MKGPRHGWSGGRTRGAGVERVSVQAPRRSDGSCKTAWALASLRRPPAQAPGDGASGNGARAAVGLQPRLLRLAHSDAQDPWLRHAAPTRLRDHRAPSVSESGLVSVRFQACVHHQCFLARRKESHKTLRLRKSSSYFTPNLREEATGESPV